MDENKELLTNKSEEEANDKGYDLKTFEKLKSNHPNKHHHSMFQIYLNRRYRKDSLYNNCFYLVVTVET